jgi:hypothetical protein
MPELTIASPYVDSNTFTMGNPLTESTLTLSQCRLYPPVRDLGFGLWTLVSAEKATPPLTSLLLYCICSKYICGRPKLTTVGGGGPTFYDRLKPHILNFTCSMFPFRTM